MWATHTALPPVVTDTWLRTGQMNDLCRYLFTHSDKLVGRKTVVASHGGVVSDIAIFVLKRDVKLQLTNSHGGVIKSSTMLIILLLLLLQMN